jgi:hypothetical protein
MEISRIQDATEVDCPGYIGIPGNPSEIKARGDLSMISQYFKIINDPTTSREDREQAMKDLELAYNQLCELMFSSRKDFTNFAQGAFNRLTTVYNDLKNEPTDRPPSTILAELFDKAVSVLNCQLHPF